MNPEHFRQSSAGRLARAGPEPHTFWIFVPNPLPPPLSWEAPLIQALSAADRALGELAGLGRTISNPHLLIRPFIRREAVLSSRIEGTQADIADLYAYEAGQLPLPGLNGTTTSEADVREVLNYVHALEYGIERLQTLPVSLRLVRELHERLLAGVRGEHLAPGEFRRTQNWIGKPGCTLADATYVPPAVDEMQGALYALEDYLHRDDENPPLVRLALIHYQFEAIHPFLDGNGRIGRLLLVLLLLSWELLPLLLLFLSAYFERHRAQYYDLLLAVSQRGAWQEWLLFFLRGVAEQAQDAIARAKQLQDLQREWRERLHEERSAGLLYGIVDLLFENPMIAAGDLTGRFGVTHRTAMFNLRKLAEMGILTEISGRQRPQRFVAAAILRCVE
jgi:Fic family protein